MKTKLNPGLFFAAALLFAGDPANGQAPGGQPPMPPTGGTQPPMPPGGQPPTNTGGQPPVNPTGTQGPGRAPSQRPHRRPSPAVAPGNAANPQFGAPLPGLTTDQLAAFREGRADFLEPEREQSGLGPIFNRNSCLVCHSGPAAGGASPINVTRFGRTVDGVFDPLASLGGSLLQERAIRPPAREFVPPVANVIARRQTTPLFGLGLIEAIPDDAILAGVHDGKPDGVAGRASMVDDVATGTILVGRFGWKGQQATLLAFAGDAYLNEMGITNRFFPTENAPNGNTALLTQFDLVADPEDTVDPADGKADVDRIADFMRFLGAPPRTALTANATAGQTLFQSTGCAVCHTPQMKTGPSTVAALNEQDVFLYSDLLLHDMGALGDGIAQGTATPKEMKTAPLWGVRASAPYLHDGRAPNLDAAIRAHDGEAKPSRDRYTQLTPAQQRQLQEFLRSL